MAATGVCLAVAQFIDGSQKIRGNNISIVINAREYMGYIAYQTLVLVIEKSALILFELDLPAIHNYFTGRCPGFDLFRQ